MRVAIIGTGVAGNVVAHHLHREHDIEVFEANHHIGGHVHTHQVTMDGVTHAVDTGFIVFNDWTYPHFGTLLRELKVPVRKSTMSFSVRDERARLEYNGTSLNTLFAQRRNLARPQFWRMLMDIRRFNAQAPKVLHANSTVASPTLGEYLATHHYSEQFCRHYIVPMGAAIWSTNMQDVMGMPAVFFIRFFHNHGMLSISRRPQWYTIQGGSDQYVQALVAPYRHRIHVDTPVQWIRRLPGFVLVKTKGAEASRFDAAFLACHSDDALALLADASPLEHEVLGAIPYTENEVVLHHDESVLPESKLSRAAWNYHIPLDASDHVTVTYDMNALQGIQSSLPLLVSLNRVADVHPDKVIKRLRYRHPLFTQEAVRAQSRHSQVNGVANTYFCGAYWRNGFHEDAVVSALDALARFHQHSQHAQRALHRAG